MFPEVGDRLMAEVDFAAAYIKKCINSKRV